MNTKRIAMIGLDTSHTVAFTKLMQSPDPDERIAEGMKVTAAMRFPSAFQPEEGQDKRQAQLEELGVTVTGDFDAAVRDADAVFLEINDPELHLEYFEKAAGLGVPVFIDKPLAASLQQADRIIALAEEKRTLAWSASSLRFIPSLHEARKSIPEAVAGHTFGMLGKAAKGSDIVWYGVHAVEMLIAGMGTGVERVRALEDDRGVVIMLQYQNERFGLIECLRNMNRYGGRLQTRKDLAFFDSGGESPYKALMGALSGFVHDGKIPVPLAEAREILAVLLSAEQSLAEDREVQIPAC